MSTPTKSRRGVEELCSPPSGNIESENTPSLGSAGGTMYPVLPQAVATIVVSMGSLDNRRTWIYVCTIICAHFIHKTTVPISDPVTVSKGLFN